MWSGVEVTHLMVCTFFECITSTVNLVMSSWINDSLQNWQKYIFTSNNLCPFWTFDWTIFLSVGNQPSLHQAFFFDVRRFLQFSLRSVFYNFHSEAFFTIFTQKRFLQKTTNLAGKWTELITLSNWRSEV